MNAKGFSQGFRGADHALTTTIRRSLPIRSSPSFPFTVRSIDPSRRNFSSSPLRLRHGEVPKFQPVSNPELQQILDDVRLKVIMPRHLRAEQQDLVRSSKKKAMLENEEVVATIHGEAFRLQHIPKILDLRETFDRIIKLLVKEDFDVLPTLFAALHQSKKRTTMHSGAWTRKATIAATKAGRQDIIIKCLQGVERTGFALGSKESGERGPLKEIISGLQAKAMKSDWDYGETKQALAWAEQVWKMIEDPRYLAPADAYYDLAGLMLELAALNASKSQYVKDGKLEEYAKRFLNLSRATNDTVHSEAWKTMRQRNSWLYWNVPVLYGMKVATTVLAPESKSLPGLLARIKEYEDIVPGIKENMSATLTKRGLTEHSWNGLKMYEQLFPDVQGA